MASQVVLSAIKTRMANIRVKTETPTEIDPVVREWMFAELDEIFADADTLAKYIMASDVVFGDGESLPTFEIRIPCPPHIVEKGHDVIYDTLDIMEYEDIYQGKTFFPKDDCMLILTVDEDYIILGIKLLGPL